MRKLTLLKRVTSATLAASIALLPLQGFAAVQNDENAASDGLQARALAALNANCDGSAAEPADAKPLPENARRNMRIFPARPPSPERKTSFHAGLPMLVAAADTNDATPHFDVVPAAGSTANFPETAAFTFDPVGNLLREANSATGAGGNTSVAKGSHHAEFDAIADVAHASRGAANGKATAAAVQLADADDPNTGLDTTRASTLNTSAQPQASATPAASPSSAAANTPTPLPSANPTATAEPLPVQTFDPYRGVLRGPGVLIATTAPAQAAVTPPPIPTPTPEPTGSSGPVYLTRDSPAPGAQSTASGATANPTATSSAGATGSGDAAASGGTLTSGQSSASTGSPASTAAPASPVPSSQVSPGTSPAPSASGSPSSAGSAAPNASSTPANAGSLNAVTPQPGASGTATTSSSGAAGSVGGAGSGTSKSTGGSPSPAPSPAPTLGPDQIAIIADDMNGATRLDKPADAIGNVHVFYRDGVMIGDRAHYDGERYITMSGHPYLQNNDADTKLYADHIVFDMQTNTATLHDGNGASSRGVQQGKIHYRADRLEATSGGRVHGQAASFSTCENPRGGYHISARSIDVTPGDKLIARSATVFLGGLAIFFIPFLSIPLNRSDAERRPVFFAPQIGYDDADGFYVKARLGFGSTNTYYGYYRVEDYTKRGIGLGYVAFIGSRNGNRQINVNAYHFRNRQSGGNTNNLAINDAEQFSKTLQGQFGATYLSEFGPYVSLPASYSFNGTVNHATERSQQAYSFSRTAVGGTQSTINAAVQDNYRFSPFANQAVSLNFSQNTNTYSGITTPTSSLHINTLTHATSAAGDFTLTIDKTNAQTPSNYNKVPEFIFHPHPLVGTIPIDTQFTLGQYTEATDTAGGTILPHKVNTPRGQFDLTAGPAIFRVLGASTFTATLGLSQYAYGTGDLKAQTRQTANLSTPIGRHVTNTIQYQQQNLAGPQAQPFQYLDVLGGVTHNAQEALTISNGGIYSLTLTTATAFDHNAQPISYQLISRPSQRSYLSVGGSYFPGEGNGFSQTNIQIATPIGKDQEIEFTTNVDWKSRGRLVNKNIYFRKIVGNCYDVRLSYNQDLKAVNLTFNLLAFPSQGANFGFSNQQRAIFPQSFVFQ